MAQPKTERQKILKPTNEASLKFPCDCFTESEVCEEPWALIAKRGVLKGGTKEKILPFGFWLCHISVTDKILQKVPEEFRENIISNNRPSQGRYEMIGEHSKDRRYHYGGWYTFSAG